MGGDLSAIVPRASRRPRTSMCLVKVGSRTVQIKTPAFQPGHSAGFNVADPFPSGACGSLRDRHARLRPGISSPLGGFATSHPPLAAVAAPLVMAGSTGHLIASGAVVNINDSVADLLHILP